MTMWHGSQSATVQPKIKSWEKAGGEEAAWMMEVHKLKLGVSECR